MRPNDEALLLLHSVANVLGLRTACNLVEVATFQRDRSSPESALPHSPRISPSPEASAPSHLNPPHPGCAATPHGMQPAIAPHPSESRPNSASAAISPSDLEAAGMLLMTPDLRAAFARSVESVFQGQVRRIAIPAHLEPASVSGSHIPSPHSPTSPANGKDYHPLSSDPSPETLRAFAPSRETSSRRGK